MKTFVEQLKEGIDEKDIGYSAGIVNVYDEHYAVTYEQLGVRNTFSIGQPVFDKDKNLMGYLGIGFFRNLNYANTPCRVPCEYWEICLPTKYCVPQRGIYTWWQNEKAKAEE